MLGELRPRSACINSAGNGRCTHQVSPPVAANGAFTDIDDDGDESGVIMSVETTTAKLAGCISLCESHVLDLSGAVRKPCIPEIVSKTSDSFISCWNSVTLHRNSLGACGRKMRALLSHRGLSALYEQPGGVLLPGEHCTHANSVCTFPHCSAVTKVASSFPVY